MRRENKLQRRNAGMASSLHGKRNCWAAAFAAILLVVAAGCSRGTASEEGAKAALVAEVTVAKVERASMSRVLAVSGTINAHPNQDVRVSSLVAGRIAQILVAEGDAVKKEQVLAKIDDKSYRDQLHQAEAAVQQANAQVENAHLVRQREETLLERGISARKEVEDARMQEKVGEATVRQAEAALALAKLQLSRTEVVSPLDGTVVKRLLSAGEAVDGTAAQPIFQVANLSSVELFGNVPAEYLGRIRVGQKMEMTTEAMPDTKWEGRVVAVSPAVDAATNMGLVRIELPNPGARLRYGMYLSVQLPIETHEGALVVPRKAIYRNEEGSTLVYKVKGDTVTAIPVTAGIEAGGRVEVTGAVEPGDTVVLEGGYGLPDGAHVKIKSAP